MEQINEQLDTSHMEIQEYDPNWAEKYQEEANSIQKLVGDKITKIEHIGSTSIPGLASKPIIDMAIEIADSKNVDEMVALLETLGYPRSINHDKDISSERYLLRKGNPTEFHLSICYADKGSFLERQILFRDYLREHNEDRDEYAKLKKESIQKDTTGKGEYINDKTDFVMRTLKKTGFQNPWFDLSKY